MARVLCLMLLAWISGSLAALELEPIEFEARDGTTVAAERGEFMVPARHDAPDGAQLKITFVRFRSTNLNPGHPIVYLAGGPGGPGTGTAMGRRFPLFMALRGVADVIAFDQRGTGWSETPPACQYTEPYSKDKPVTRDAFLPYVLEAAAYCDQKWRQQGVDLGAFTTWESAGDLEVLRRELGAGKLNLWGISYGTHLALAAMKRMGDRLDRVVLASPEGLNQTLKLPERSDRFFERVAALVAADTDASQAYPDLLGTMRLVLDRLEREPATVTIMPAGETQPVNVTFDRMAVQLLTSFGLVKNPQNIAALPITYYGLAAGQYEQVAQRLYEFAYGRPQAFHAMSTAMDGASGITRARLALYQEQSKTALIGDALNYPYPHLFGAFSGVRDLGDEFRTEVESDVPTLVFTGTLDGRTFPEAHEEILRGLSNGQQVVIENAGHDLFMSSPLVTALIKAFLMGEELSDTRIRLAPPAFVLP